MSWSLRTNGGAEPRRDSLNAQRFYLLVDPAYYKSALLIFDRIKKEFGFASFGLVDIGKLRERETIRPRDDSLARKVDTDNKLARSYIDYLLGRVVCCRKAEQLRNLQKPLLQQTDCSTRDMLSVRFVVS